VAPRALARPDRGHHDGQPPAPQRPRPPLPNPHAVDITVHYGIPVTTPARTLLDLAGILDHASLTRAVHEARLNRHLRLDALADILARSPGRARMRLKPHVEHQTGPTRSAFEDAFLAFAQRVGLPRPLTTHVVTGREVDIYWPDQRLIVELDSREYHDDADAFEHDRDKDADLVAAGLRVVRVTWSRLTQEPEREAARLRRLHAHGRPHAASIAQVPLGGRRAV
jgi:hypothetical protein